MAELYPCPNCDKAFTNVKALAGHQNAHTKRRLSTADDVVDKVLRCAREDRPLHLTAHQTRVLAGLLRPTESEET